MFSPIVEEHIKKFLYYYAFLFSILFSIILINSRAIVNTDGVIYLAASQAFLDGGVSAAMSIDRNIFLPILIAFTHQLTNLSLITSADIVNTLLMSFLTLSFVYLVKQLGGNRNIQFIAALLILLNPSLIGYRELFFRDQGFWALSILSLALLLRFEKEENIKILILWVASIGGAFLFRPEAAIFILAPLGLVFTKEAVLKRALFKLSKVYFAVLLGGLAGFLFLHLTNLDSVYLGGIEHLKRYSDPNQVDLVMYSDMSIKFSEMFAYPYPDEYTWLGFGLSLLPYLLTSIVGAIGWSMLLTFIYCFYKKVLVFPIDAMYRTYAYLSLIVLIMFLFTMFFTTPRYATFLGLLLLTALPFSLYKLYAGKVYSIKAKSITAFCVFVLVVDCFVSFGYSTTYVSDGIEWVNQNTESSSRVISNERNITYTIEREKEFNDSLIVFNAWYKSDVARVLAKYDYFVEDTFYNKEEILLDSIPEAKEVARFTSERGNRLVVYKLP